MAYEMRMSDGSSDVCSSDLVRAARPGRRVQPLRSGRAALGQRDPDPQLGRLHPAAGRGAGRRTPAGGAGVLGLPDHGWPRSEEHTSELQSLMRISYAAFCLKKKSYSTRLTPILY